ncbi:meiosis-specific with OB domain-containing protein [Parasteatoda tepidariorum]|uniref:meiosis-specific with OB domain-containing protein n=1 Tax=Parasteatoda tepidariorum TaxID=114398 RepID=UPI00077F9C05|nr:meiosis-specific with OB domain-containing protein [Parasteatoda tepidariorum]
MAWISDNYGFDYDCEVTYQKVSIRELSSELSQAIIYGIIIAKQEMRRIDSRKQPGTERYVLNFTLRDSLTDTINAACWGEENAISKLSTSFTIGDVVKIRNPQIIERQSAASDEKFKPSTTSHYQLNIHPLYSEITVCQADERRSYEKFLHCSTRSISEIVSLADVVYDCQTAEGLIINLLVAIREIGTVQNVKTKDGREVKKFQLSVFDQSHPKFNILIWGEETANFIIKYCQKRSILLITDIKINYNTFTKEMAGTTGNMTIFTPDPDIPDARVLYQYAMKTALPADKIKDSNSTDVSTTYTMEEILKFIHSTEMNLDEIQGTVNAIISFFDIDGTSNTTAFRCPKCMQPLQSSADKCKDENCDIGNSLTTLPAEEIYNFIIRLSDHSGSIERCHLSGNAAKNMLGIEVADFLRLSDDDKTNLKWNFLFERVSVQFKLSYSTMGNGRYFFRILSCCKME